MKKLIIKELLQKYLEARQVLQLQRDKIDKNPINCIPLIMGQQLVIVQYLYDFQIDGYKIIRLKDITSVRSDEVERFYECILEKEGISNQVKEPPIVNLNNWGTVFKELKFLEEYIIIECEKIENGKFYIGKIIEVNSNSLLFLRFDAIGEWDQETSKILYKDITSVSFNDRYTTTISKYVKQS